MNLETLATSSAAGTARHRDADNTRELLIQSARRRFAHDGYGATTVRDIATDAGVNVALINRYFTSKEGLFEACLTRAVKDFDDVDTEASTIDQILRVLVDQVTDTPNSERPLQMLLLLRTSGDAGVDRIRRDTLRDFSVRMARASGWQPDQPDFEAGVLRAQLVLSTAFGILLLRASSDLEPLGSASAPDLEVPLRETLNALLTPPLR